MPKVTVLMAVYNGDRYLREAIESILGQSFQDFEFLIVNDGSTDSSREVILSYDDPRIRLIDNEKNLGQTRSLNRGLELAKGKFIARQDADDISAPQRLARQTAFLESQPEVALAGTWYQEVDASGTLIAERQLPSTWTEIRWWLLFFCPFVHSSVMFRKSMVLDRIGQYDETLAYSQDYDLWLRIARVLPVANLEEYLVKFRLNPWSMTMTYGRRAQEGHCIRVANIERLLKRRGTETSELRFNRMISLLLDSGSRLSPAEVKAATEDVLELQAAFRTEYGIGRTDARRHRAKLRYEIGLLLTQLAHQRFDTDIAAARQLFAAAHYLSSSILISAQFVWLALKLLVGARLIRTIKHLIAQASA
jgi:hypothetical protein